MAGLGNSALTRAQSIRRSLKLATKKDKGKSARVEPLVPVSEGSVEEKKEDKEEEEEVLEEIEEAYILPEIPHTPLSGTDALTCTCCHHLG